MNMHERENDRINTLLQDYLAADYRWQHGRDWHDLRIGLPAPGPELAHPDAGTFALLSAWNPHSVPRPESVNREADQALEEILQSSGRIHVPAFSSAPDRSWREPSWLVMGMTPAEVDALGRRFRQLGVLVWKRSETVRLRMLSAQPDHVDDPFGLLGFVDWVE